MPGKDAQYEDMQLHYLDERILGTPSIAVAQVLKEVERMAQIARQNFALSMQTFFKPSSTVNQQIKQNEQVLNYLNHNITGYLVKIHALDLLESDSRRVGSLFHVVNDLERVGDHAENILEYSQNLGGGEPPFSADAITEMQDMQDRVLKIVDESIAFFLSNHPDPALSAAIVEQEEEIDDLVVALREHHVERLGRMECSPETGMVYGISLPTSSGCPTTRPTSCMRRLTPTEPDPSRGTDFGMYFRYTVHTLNRLSICRQTISG